VGGAYKFANQSGKFSNFHSAAAAAAGKVAHAEIPSQLSNKPVLWLAGKWQTSEKISHFDSHIGESGI